MKRAVGTLGAIVQASLDSSTQNLLVFGEIVASRGLDVLMTSQILDEGDVRSIVTQIRAEGVPQHVRCQWLCNPGFPLQVREESADILSPKPAHWKACSHEQGRVIIGAPLQILLYPDTAA